MTRPERMSNVDAAWLGMDAPENLMMVTAVLALDEVVESDRVAGVLQERMLDRFPRFRMRAVPSGSPFEQPVWQDDPGFTLDDHLVDGGEVADEHALRERVSELLGTPLDMTRSPWRIELVTIASPYGGRPSSALVARLHHCLADGIALAQVLLSLTDDSGPDDGGAGSTAQAAAATDARRPGLLARLRSGSAEVAPITGVDVLGARSVRQAAAAVRLGWDVARTGLGLLLANRDPRTRLRGPLGTDKAAAWSTPVDLRLVKRVATAINASVNDVMLAVTAGALRGHLVDHGDRPHDLRVFVPVDLRRGAAVPPTLGNRFGMVFIRLPLSVSDPVQRVRAVHEGMSRLKGGRQAAATFALLAVVGALPAWGPRLAVRVLGAKSTAVVTNVPGPHRPVWLAGSRVVRIVFWVPQAGGIGLGVSILSYAGEIGVGLAADRRLVPDPAALVARVEDELDRLARDVLAVDDSAVELEAVPFDSDLAQTLVAEVQQEYVKRYGGHDETPVDPTEFVPPYGTFLVARVGTTAIGCAGLRQHEDGVVEVKRMFVRPEHRRRGHARRLLAALEDVARESGNRRVVLETGLAQPEAIALYTSAGYQPIDGFGFYKSSPLSRSFARDL